MKTNFGYIPDVPKDTDYILGGASPIEGVILSPTGQWLNRIPQGENQRRYNIETSSCVSFGILNILEILMKEVFGVGADYSDRYLSSMSETTPQGNSPSDVADELRKEAGCVDEVDLPFTEEIKSFNDYVIPKSLIQLKLKRKGEEWLSKYELRYEKVFVGGSLENKRKQLMEGLRRSPIGVSVYAWTDNYGTYYKPENVEDNHFTCLVGYEEGKKWYVYDSYPESEGDFIKELDWNYNFGSAMIFYLRNIEAEISNIEKIIAWIVSYLPFLKKQVEEAIKKKPNMDEKPKVEEKDEAVVSPAEPPKVETPKYEWNTKENIKSSIRKVAIEEKIDPELACRVAQCESGLNPKAKRQNTDSHKSIDRGLYQWNNYWHPSITDEMAYNPETACRLFCKAVRNGHISWWNASRKCWNIV